MNKKTQLKTALDICAKTFDISEKEIKEIIKDTQNIRANDIVKHTFRGVMCNLSKSYKEEGYHCYTLQEIAVYEGNSTHANVIKSRNIFNDALNGKGKDGHTKVYKTANYFLKECLK